MRHITTAGAALLRKFTTTRGRRQTPTRRRAGIPLGVEGLEERSLLAASASLLNNGALLEVKGTDGRDTIRVSRTGNEVKVDFNGAAPSKTFSAAKLTLIKVFGYKENDYISTYGVNVNASLVGGDGHDSLYGGLGKDSLYGSEGMTSSTATRATTTSRAGPGTTACTATPATTSSTAGKAMTSSRATTAATPCTAGPAPTP